MTDIVYTTQLLINSAIDGEDVVSLYRRVQRRLWEWLEEEFPPFNDENRVLNEIPFNQFSTERSWSVSSSDGNNLSGRYLETDKIMTQGIQIVQRQPSAWVPHQSDNTLVTDVCIEAPKIIHPMIKGVCFSCKVAIQCQPFAGFFPRRKLSLVAPRVVKDILEMEGCLIEFHPFGRGVFTDACKYIVSSAPNLVSSEVDESVFLSMLEDVHRPVCLVVFMGDGHRQLREAKYIAEVAASKAMVCVLRKSKRLVLELERIVVGMDAKKDFSKGRCRVFFPFGPEQYSNKEFANPNYRIPFVQVKRFRYQLLVGLLRYFDMKQPWRRDKRDVHLTELEWMQNRAYEQKEQEAEYNKNEAKTNKDILSSLLEKRKEEREQYDCDRKYLMDAATELESQKNAALNENKKLFEENKQLKMGQKGVDEISLAVGSLFPGEVKEHLLETISDAIKMLGCNRERRLQILKELLQKNGTPRELHRRREIIKHVFKGSNGLSDGDFKEFEKIGVVLVSANKHYKVRFGTLSDTISKTPSDKRACKNQITQMNNKFF